MAETYVSAKNSGPSNGAIVVAIDGPAGAGKSTVARAVARAVGYTLVDTGAIYRVVALQAMRAGLAAEDEAALTGLAEALNLCFVAGAAAQDPDRVFMGEEDVTDAIRTPEVSDMAARVSARPLLRRSLVALQRRLAGEGNAVLEGRDIGTVICPQAPLKFFLHASLEERARRRHEELLNRGDARELAAVAQDIARRDGWDAQRAVAPLRAAEDAVGLDSTALRPEEVVATIVAAIRSYAAAQTSRAAGDKTTPDLARLFAEVLPARLAAYADKVGAVGGTYAFVATGPGGGSWSLDLDATPAKIGPGSNDDAACRVSVSSENLLAMLEGRLNPQKAFMQGLMLVQGDVTLALRLGAVLA